MSNVQPAALLAALAPLALSLLASACGVGSEPAPSDPTTATYYQDIKPILDAKCVGCVIGHGAWDAPSAVVVAHHVDIIPRVR